MCRTSAWCLLFCALVLCALVHFSPLAASAAPITVPTVPVGNVNNADDSTGFGGVGYAYNIGTTEVTIGQYTAFLNAVGAADPYELYNPSMATDLNIGRIIQSGSSGSYTYSVSGITGDLPVTYVSWGDAARFANWLHNGQPSGAQGPGTTETGAYTLNGATSTTALNSVVRDPGATWFIPSESEWYKAAYYQPAAQGGDSDSYWDYPMRTNSAPYSDQPPGATPDNTRVGNFRFDDGLANGYNDGFSVTGSTAYSLTQLYLTEVGAYASSSSFYGTYDQGGNVYEWNEALIGLSRGLRAGTWDDGSPTGLAASTRNTGYLPTSEFSTIGFRVATIPEPSTAVLGVIGCVLMLWWSKRRK